MEKLEKYRKIIRDLLTTHVSTADLEIESQVILDTEHDHYQLVDVGWQGLHRIYFRIAASL